MYIVQYDQDFGYRIRQLSGIWNLFVMFFTNQVVLFAILLHKHKMHPVQNFSKPRVLQYTWQQPPRVFQSNMSLTRTKQTDKFPAAIQFSLLCQERIAVDKFELISEIKLRLLDCACMDHYVSVW